MKVVVIGAGEVGNHLTAHLAADGHDVLLIEADAAKAAVSQDQLNALVVQGNGASMKVLERVGARDADLIAAVTNLDEVNIVACVSGKALGIPRRIARVTNEDFYITGAGRSMREVGVDLMINPDLVAALEIERLVSLPGATDVVDFGEARVRMVGAYVLPGARAIGVSLRDVAQQFGPQPATVVAIIRDGATLIPDGQTRLIEGDHVYLVGPRGAMRDLMGLLGHDTAPIRNVMLVGASPIARTVARHLVEHKVQVKLIENLRSKAEWTADQLDRVLVLNGDGTDAELLKSESVDQMDAFIATTNSDDTNIMSCVLARHLGVDKTITTVRRSDYIPLLPAIGLHAAVSVRLATAATIMRFCRKGEIVSMAQLKEIDAEVLELVVREDARAVGRTLSKLHLPKGAVVGSVIRRDGALVVPRGNTEIEHGDRVVVFALPATLPAVEKAFA